MPIIGGLPFNITNGTLADAEEVMGNFDFIVSQVNTNASGSPADTTHISVICVTPVNFVSATVTTLGTSAQTAIVEVDTLSEYDLTTGQFIVQTGGLYQFMITGYGGGTATFSDQAGFRVLSNGTQPATFGVGNSIASPLANGTIGIYPSIVMAQCVVGQVITFALYGGVITGGAASTNRYQIIVNRIA